MQWDCWAVLIHSSRYNFSPNSRKRKVFYFGYLYASTSIGYQEQPNLESVMWAVAKSILVSDTIQGLSSGTVVWSSTLFNSLVYFWASLLARKGHGCKIEWAGSCFLGRFLWVEDNGSAFIQAGMRKNSSCSVDTSHTLVLTLEMMENQYQQIQSNWVTFSRREALLKCFIELWCLEHRK